MDKNIGRFLASVLALGVLFLFFTSPSQAPVAMGRTVRALLSTPQTSVPCDLLPVRDSPAFVPLKRPQVSFVEAWLKPETSHFGTPPEEIPPMLRDAYTLDGRINVTLWYRNQFYFEKNTINQAPAWTVDLVNSYRVKVRSRDTQTLTYYPTENAFDTFDQYSHVMKGHGLVIGSETPWIESMILEYSDRYIDKITTVDFGSLRSEHPKLHTIVAREYTKLFVTGNFPQVDFVWSFSSIEHDGLGRYGDILNPIGDLQTMARLLTVVKPGGFAFICVPHGGGVDTIFWNAHRMYGVLRTPLLLAGWRIIDTLPHGEAIWDGGWSGIWVLQNPYGCHGEENFGDDMVSFKQTMKRFS